MRGAQFVPVVMPTMPVDRLAISYINIIMDFEPCNNVG